jgi:hypothetical protein
VKELWEQTLAQVNEQAGAATAKLGQGLGSLADELYAIGDGTHDGQGPVGNLARALAARGDDLTDLLVKQGPDGVVQELRRFAQRSPGTFLLGALAVGVVGGRLTRGAQAAAGANDNASGTPAPAKRAAPTTATSSTRRRR